jgi:hypothetical protein
MNHFIDGIADEEIQGLVRMSRPSTMEMALTNAMELDASRRATRFNRKSVRIAAVSSPTDSSTDDEADGGCTVPVSAAKVNGKTNHALTQEASTQTIAPAKGFRKKARKQQPSGNASASTPRD